ncbi:uncharacterized protein LOC144197256 [Stigmatopora nigra]
MAEGSDFEDTLTAIGGKERIYLVSDAGESNDASESDAAVLLEFLGDLFGDRRPLSALHTGGQCHDKPGHHSNSRADDLHADGRTLNRRTSSSSRRRSIDCPAIVFLFRQTFFNHQACLKEVLKDVRARTKGTLPALVGLVRLTAGEQGDENRLCVRRLEMLLHKVFSRHQADAIWVGSFVPGSPSSVLDIKKNVGRAIACSLTADITRNDRDPLFWPFQCLFRSNRGETRRAASNPPTSKQRGDSGSTEENIPLKNSSKSAAGPNEESMKEGA